MYSLDKLEGLKMYKKIKSLGSITLLMLVSIDTYAANSQSFGEFLSGHGVSELQRYFSFLIIAVALIGFAIVALCLVGMAMMKLKPNSPVTQQFEQAGMGGLAMGILLGSAMMALGSIVYFFIGTSAGTGADTSAFEKLKSSAYIETKLTPEASRIASLDLNYIELKG